MEVVENNFLFLQGIDWQEALKSESFIGGKARLTITVSEESGAIQRVASHTFAIDRTVFAGLVVSYDEEKKFPYSLELENFDSNKVWEVVDQAIKQFNGQIP